MPDASVDHLVGVVEVLVQEGIGTFAVPVHAEALEVLPPIFGARARIGAASVRSADDARRAIELGAGFILADLVDDGLITTANDAAIAHYAPAMTPTEVRAVLARPITGVALTPADVVGHAMAAHLRDLGIVDRVVPIGGIGAYAAGEWMKAGAPAAAVGSTLLGTRRRAATSPNCATAAAPSAMRCRKSNASPSDMARDPIREHCESE